ncbi:Importin subunit alpha-8 [Apodemus speciosus]|uniref:Importin subunit alpha-8 n=1 Tax=Apodemus speciosus TaxID=105296 RepID=A0ABQ0EYZ7_APOSI
MLKEEMQDSELETGSISPCVFQEELRHSENYPRRQQTSRNQRLDELFGPGGRIAQGSGSLRLHKGLGMLRELAERLQHTSIDGLLGLLVCSCGNTARSAERVCQGIEVLVGHKFYEPVQDPYGYMTVLIASFGENEVGHFDWYLKNQVIGELTDIYFL